MNKQLLLGDEAIAQAAIDAGMSGVYAYPGTPSTEITEYVQASAEAQERGIFSRWCTNEKTAMEGALGMSYVGKRALVCMKHVGLNVAADAFVNSAMTGVNGGLVVLVADDPSMHSSQNEQDSRFYGKFAMLPTFEPSNQQEAYDMMYDAFAFSEKMGVPVLMRIVTRLAHSRAGVARKEMLAQNELSFPKNPRQFILLPAISRERNKVLISEQKLFTTEAENSKYNFYTEGSDKSIGIVACGIGYNYVMENFQEGLPYSILKVSQYPLPLKQLQELYDTCDKVLVVEDGQPFVEEQIRGVLPSNEKVIGRLNGVLPRDGELTPDSLAVVFGKPFVPTFEKPEVVTMRPPALCQGCGHRDVYDVLNEIVREYENYKVFSDIGCYTLGALPPFRAIDSCVDMGASITMAKGAADAGLFPSVAVIGDSTFTHSGMTGLLDCVNSNSNVTIIISDNETTAMTGGQDSAGTGRLEAICCGLGVDPAHVRVMIPLKKNYEEMRTIIREEINYNGVSVIIPRRECIQTLSRKAKNKSKQA